MANALSTLFTDIANAIRAKTGEPSTATMKPAEFPQKITDIDITVDAVLETLEATENGTFTPSEGADGFSSVTVDVKPILSELNVTKNGVYTPNDGVDGFSNVVVSVKSANTCYIGTDAPDSTIGNDGDIYIVKE